MSKKVPEPTPPSYYIKRAPGGYYALFQVKDGVAKEVSQPDFLAITLSKLQTAITDDLKV